MMCDVKIKTCVMTSNMLSELLQPVTIVVGR